MLAAGEQRKPYGLQKLCNQVRGYKTSAPESKQERLRGFALCSHKY